MYLPATMIKGPFHGTRASDGGNVVSVATHGCVSRSYGELMCDFLYSRHANGL
ncbi:predicted protein [Botrytis cinerea T4]|uniref:Uncharacterized protein n=1 Tax=Botryotinia fuckeliana (strain T4) TaxID=999810 RepID=G2YBQ0_BOTF4|nr:predicted protein [Botrytis cinerea T4]